MKLLLKLCISFTLENPKGIYRHQGYEGPGDRSGPKRRARRGRRAAETRPKPRFRGHSMAARAALRATRGPVCVLSVPVPGFVFAAPDFDESALLGQWL